MFPKNERHALADQMQRAVVSIGSNIAEGCSRESEKDFAHFLSMAISLSFELETQMRIALNLKNITEERYNGMVETLSVTERQIHALIKNVSQSKSQSQRQSQSLEKNEYGTAKHTFQPS